MENAQKNALLHFLSGLIGGFVAIGLLLGLIIAYPIDAANLLVSLTRTPTGQIAPVPPNATAIDSQNTITSVVKRVNPAVVSITLTQQVAQSTTPSVDPFQQFFGIPSPFGNANPPQATPRQPSQPIDVGGGTGFFVTPDGYIVTNRHVVDQAGTTLTITTTDGKDHTAKVIATDPVYDIAVLKIDGTGYPFLTFGNSSNLEVGDTVIAIGNALAEFQNTVSVGIVSGLSRSITAGTGPGDAEQLTQLIQTDAAINPGNSGGPLLDLNGNVIGVNVAMAGAQNIGFALPANIVKTTADSVIQTGKISRPYLGIRYIPVTADLKAQDNLTVDYGALILRGSTAADVAVQPNSPAAKAGLKENDIVLQIDGVKLDDSNPLSTVIRSKSVGQTITMQVLRGGKTITLKATLTEYPQ
jgi:serine protease Do